MNTRFAVFLVLFLFMASCKHQPETPEEVLKEYLTCLNEGNCKDALNYCDEEGKLVVQATIDSGCEPYETKIDSITCNIQDTVAKCICYEYRENQEWAVRYKLLKTEGEWKVTGLPKDSIDW